VKEYFSGGDPVGQEIRVVGLSSTSPWFTIVGVVEDWKHMEWDARWAASPTVFRPLAQDPTADGSVGVRSEGNLAGLPRAISEQIKSVDPLIPNYAIETLVSRLEKMRAYPRFRAFIVSLFALTALAIAAVGLHGTLTQFVSRRAPEFGLRRALGARTANLFWLVAAHGGIPVVGGLLAGALAAAVVVRLAVSLFEGFQSWNPARLVWSVVLLLAVAAIAIALPARRAASVDPMTVLREE
jgi:predicted lysophospholipase L1 biosynthesis ABC-type transport system permease subunit